MRRGYTLKIQVLASSG